MDGWMHEQMDRWLSSVPSSSVLCTFSGLYTVVLVLVVPEVEGEDVWGRGPAPDRRQRPRLQDGLRLLVQPDISTD